MGIFDQLQALMGGGNTSSTESDPRLGPLQEIASKQRQPVKKQPIWERQMPSNMPVIDPNDPWQETDDMYPRPGDDAQKFWDERKRFDRDQMKGLAEGTFVGPPSPPGFRGGISSSDGNAYHPGYGYSGNYPKGDAAEGAAAAAIDNDRTDQKKFEPPTDSYRSQDRDFYSDNPEEDAEFEAAARSSDPIAAYKKLQDKYGISDEELDDLIRSYSDN